MIVTQLCWDNGAGRNVQGIKNIVLSFLCSPWRGTIKTTIIYGGSMIRISYR